MRNYYAIGALPTASFAQLVSRVRSEADKLAARAKKETKGLVRAAESHIKGKAKEGALDATPAIRSEVRKEVTPYIAGAIGVGIVAIIIAARK